jgi:hypothetical protein
MIAQNDDAHKISVRIESGAAGRPRARSLRASADERRRAGLDHTVIPGWTTQDDVPGRPEVDDQIDGQGNHSCDPNTWWVDDFTFVTRREIAVDEEVTNGYVGELLRAPDQLPRQRPEQC